MILSYGNTSGGGQSSSFNPDFVQRSCSHEEEKNLFVFIRFPLSLFLSSSLFDSVVESPPPSRPRVGRVPVVVVDGVGLSVVLRVVVGLLLGGLVVVRLLVVVGVAVGVVGLADVLGDQLAQHGGALAATCEGKYDM